MEEDVGHFIQRALCSSNFWLVLISWKSIIIKYMKRKIISEKSELPLTPYAGRRLFDRNQVQQL